MQDDSLPTSTPASAPGTGTQTLLRGLAVVQAVAAGARDLKAIARHIGTTRSTTHRLASCLVEERYLRVLPQVGYLLGPKLIELGFQAREEVPLVALAMPFLDELSRLTGDTVHLAIRDGDEVLYLHKNPGRNGPEMRSRVGHRMPMARTGIGKALLLDSTEEEWQRLYLSSLPSEPAHSSRPSHVEQSWSQIQLRMKEYVAGGMRSTWKTTNRRFAALPRRCARRAGRSSRPSAWPVRCPTCRWRKCATWCPRCSWLPAG